GRDNRTAFYVSEDATTKRPNQLWRHRIGSDPARDALVYEETDAMFDLEVERSRSKAYVFATSASKTTSEVRALRADRPEGTFAVVQPREHGHEYYVQHRSDLFYIRTNSGGRNFQLVTSPV